MNDDRTANDAALDVLGIDREDLEKRVQGLLRRNLSGFFRRHREVESAPRWTCPECHFESNEYDRSHHQECPRREAVLMRRILDLELRVYEEQRRSRRGHTDVTRDERDSHT